MTSPSDISESIIDALYCEALVMADEVRAAFDLQPVTVTETKADNVRLALSVEGLRTTTRVMHVLAWLLNQRAYYSGEMSEFQLRRHGTLPDDRASDEANLSLFDPAIRALIEASEALHARVARLDLAWREKFRARPSAILSLRERLGREYGRG